MTLSQRIARAILWTYGALLLAGVAGLVVLAVHGYVAAKAALCWVVLIVMIVSTVLAANNYDT
jgi:hypothetical protein